MSNEQREAHPLSVIAAEVVRNMQDKPGTWDFEQAFRPYVELIKLQTREDENRITLNAESAQTGKLLYLFNRGLELKKAIYELKERNPRLME